MDDLNKITKNLYKVVIAFKDALSLPTDSSLYVTFKYSCILTGISILSTLLRFYTFLSWYGCLACTVILLLLLFLERSENNALSEMYRVAKLRTEQVKRRAKKASSSTILRRPAGGGTTSAKNTREGTVTDGVVSNKRHSTSTGAGTKNKRSSLFNR